MSALPSSEAAVDVAPVASLAMYDPPPVRAANDTLWEAIAHQLALVGVEAPERLTRDADLHEVWRAPSLLLAQTCGYPLMTALRDTVQLVATPRYRATGCSGAFHRSLVVVGLRSGLASLSALRGRRCAINDRKSNTGMNLLRAEIAPLAQDGRFFAEVQVTGSHAASLRAVAMGQADVAAIDAVTFALLARHEPGLAAAVRVIAWTRACPGLPLVTGAATPRAGVEVLRRALDAVAADPRLASVRDALLLDGFTVLPEHLYRQIPYLEQDAARRGYPELA